MTYGEIYDEIILKCFPNSVPPENMPAYIRRKIKACQRMINRDYNFWFTLRVNTIDTIVGQRDYTLPLDYKEMEKAYFSIHLQTYDGPELGQINLTDHVARGYLQDDSAVEYPSKYRVDGFNLSLYPKPSEIRILNLLYWKFLPLVDIEPTTIATAFTPYSDDISLYCADCIIYHVTADVKLDQNEWQAYQMYKQEYLMAIEGAKYEDNIRRSIPETEAPI